MRWIRLRMAIVVGHCISIYPPLHPTESCQGRFQSPNNHHTKNNTTLKCNAKGCERHIQDAHGIMVHTLSWSS
ncbi:hypothetical protein F5Y15DRAFT_338330 [Xylariaceae sp. FL0016]|nr:hypothetical protein F5Y15DRAFT_338330 [Xylariaceae sp. FL0016]